MTGEDIVLPAVSNIFDLSDIIRVYVSVNLIPGK